MEESRTRVDLLETYMIVTGKEAMWQRNSLRSGTEIV